MSEGPGARNVATTNPAEVLALEHERGVTEIFAALDALTSEIVIHSLAGNRVAAFRRNPSGDQLEFFDLSDVERTFIRERYDLAAQQARGAWFLPEQVSIHVGPANFPYHFARYERFASGIAQDEAGRTSLKESPEALFFWAVLDSLFDILYRPFQLRGAEPPVGTAEERKAAWREVDDAYAALGIDAADALEVMRFGGGWSKLRASEQIEAKRKLLVAIRNATPGNVGARYRVWSTQALIEKYHAKSKRGRPSMRQVLTKPLQRTLSAFYGGDWLAFLRYLGEDPNPEEQISTTLPEPRLYVNAAARTTAVAAKHGIAPEEVERMLAAFWTSSGSESPVHQRIAVLREFWKRFDAIHARQAAGMRPLWGFVDEGEGVSLKGVDHTETGPPWYHPGQWRELLDADLIGRIQTLWDGVFVPTSPDRIVSAISPYSRMVEAFGPALRFWNGAALTAWFVSEGPSSRTDMKGLAEYHSRDLTELQALGCPVDAKLFDELIAAEKVLGKPQEITEPEHDYSFNAGGLKFSVSMTIGSRRSGFERLRDVITAHRRAWSDRYLEPYFKARWETEIRAAAREYTRLLEVKRKPPTPKQFAKYAEPAANHWFGGDVSLLYAAFGEKSPVTPTRQRLLPRDLDGFMLQVFNGLGGRITDIKMDDDMPEGERERRQAEWNAHWKRKELAELSVRYVQLREALGERPEMSQIGSRNFEYLGVVLDSDIPRAWEQFAAAVDRVLGI